MLVPQSPAWGAPPKRSGQPDERCYSFRPVARRSYDDDVNSEGRFSPEEYRGGLRFCRPTRRVINRSPYLADRWDRMVGEKASIVPIVIVQLPALPRRWPQIL
jgi:hypothetical protein